MKKMLLISLITVLLWCSGCSDIEQVEPGSIYDPIAEAEADYDLGQYVECMETIQAYIMAVKRGEIEKQDDVLARAFKLLGNVYYMYGDTSAAEKYYETSLKYTDNLSDKTEQLKIIYNLALVNVLKGDQVGARRSAQRILSVDPASEGLRRYYHAMASGVIEHKFGDINSSISMLDSAVRLIDEHKLSGYLKASPMMEIADTYIESKRYPEALEMLAKVEKEIETGVALPYVAINVMNSYKNIYSELGDTDNAYKYQQRFDALSDSLTNQNRFLKARSAFISQDEHITGSYIKSVSRSLAISHWIIVSLIIAGLLLMLYFLLYRRAKRKRLSDSDADIVQISSDKDSDHTESHPVVESNAAFRLSPRYKDLFEKTQEIVDNPEFFTDPEASLEKLSHTLRVNVKYISQAINEGSGMNFRSFLNRRRIFEAQKIIDSSLQSAIVTELGRQVGFLSQSAFIASFKKFTGMTPSLYVRKAREDSGKE